MSRTLIVMGVAVGLVALGAAAWVLVGPGRNGPVSTETAEVTPAPAVETPAETFAQPAPVVQSRTPARVVETVAAPAVIENPPTEGASAQARTGDAQVDLASIVNGLDEEQEKALYAAVRKREKAHQAEMMKYSLPGDYVLRRADLKLSDAQEQRIAGIKDSLKAQMDEALGPVREQMKQWGERQQGLWKSKSLEDQRDPNFQAQVRAASDEYGVYMKQMQQLQEPFDQEYMSRAREVLSADQVQTLDTAIAEQEKQREEMRARWGMGGPGGFGQ